MRKHRQQDVVTTKPHVPAPPGPAPRRHRGRARGQRSAPRGGRGVGRRRENPAHAPSPAPSAPWSGGRAGWLGRSACARARRAAPVTSARSVRGTHKSVSFNFLKKFYLKNKKKKKKETGEEWRGRARRVRERGGSLRSLVPARLSASPPFPRAAPRRQRRWAGVRGRGARGRPAGSPAGWRGQRRAGKWQPAGGDPLPRPPLLPAPPPPERGEGEGRRSLPVPSPPSLLPSPVPGLPMSVSRRLPPPLPPPSRPAQPPHMCSRAPPQRQHQKRRQQRGGGGRGVLPLRAPGPCLGVAAGDGAGSLCLRPLRCGQPAPEDGSTGGCVGRRRVGHDGDGDGADPRSARRPFPPRPPAVPPGASPLARAPATAAEAISAAPRCRGEAARGSGLCPGGEAPVGGRGRARGARGAGAAAGLCRPVRPRPVRLRGGGEKRGWKAPGGAAPGAYLCLLLEMGVGRRRPWSLPAPSARCWKGRSWTGTGLAWDRARAGGRALPARAHLAPALGKGVPPARERGAQGTKRWWWETFPFSKTWFFQKEA